MLLAVAYHDGGRGCTASVATLCRETSYRLKSERAARATLRRLCKRGLIRQKPRRGRTSIFVLTEVFYGDA